MWRSLEALEKAAQLGLMRKDVVDRDMETVDGDLYRMFESGPVKIQDRLKELRPMLSENENKAGPPQLGRIQRAWDILWDS
jgi:hypothetical protein